MPDMGLAADLSYAFPRANWLQRGIKAFAGTRPGAWLFSKFPRRRNLTAPWVLLTG